MSEESVQVAKFAKKQIIDFGKGHTVVVGATQQGKSHGTMKSLLKKKEGVFFFNVKHDEGLKRGFTKATGKNNIQDIVNMLQAGKKINFVPSVHQETMVIQLVYLIKQLHERVMEKRMKPFYFVADEMVILSKYKQAVNALDTIAVTGESLGMWGVWIGQRLAQIDNTLISQSNNGIVMFNMNFENNYLKRYGIDGDHLKQLVTDGGQYSYCHYNWTELKGAYKV
jgi:hypothetical protein